MSSDRAYCDSQCCCINNCDRGLQILEKVNQKTVVYNLWSHLMQKFVYVLVIISNNNLVLKVNVIARSDLQHL